MFEATELERTILSDIEARTGLTFRLVGGIDTREVAIANAVLPVLLEWPGKIADPSHRHGIYSRFLTPHAYPYFDQLVLWWIEEQNKLALSCLTQCLALLVKCKDAERVWRLCKELPRRLGHYELVSRLAACTEVEKEVKEALVHGLETEPLRAGDLADIGKVDDPRIREWFKGQVESPDPAIRVVARRVLARKRALPRGVAHAGAGPDRSRELFSTEVDIECLRPLIEGVGKEFDVKIPAAIARGRFLSAVEVEQWLVAYLAGGKSGGLSLWFRLEDIDTVEVLLLRESAEGARVQ